jgi:hypothetical protein
MRRMEAQDALPVVPTKLLLLSIYAHPCFVLDECPVEKAFLSVTPDGTDQFRFRW